MTAHDKYVISDILATMQEHDEDDFAQGIRFAMQRLGLAK